MINTAGLSLDQAPPLFVPFKFFLTASLFVLAAGLLLMATGEDLYLSRWSPQALALTHLITVGFLAQVMSGAMFQLLPVMVGTPLPSVVALGRIVNLGLLLGAVLLSGGFLLAHNLLLVAGGVVLCVGFLLFLLASGTALIRASVPLPMTVQLGIGWLSIIPAAALGMLMVLALTGALTVGDMPALVTLHLSWGVLGWVGIVLFAVLFRLVPVFYVAREIPALAQRLISASVFFLLILFTLSQFTSSGSSRASLYLVVFVLCLSAVGVFVTLYRRKRAIIDATLMFIWTGLACLLLAALFWLSGGREVLLGVLMLGGVGLSIPIGVIYRVLPFLCWFHLQGLQIERKRLDRHLPPMKHYIQEHAARRHFYLHMAAVLLLLAGEFFSRPFDMLPGAAVVGSGLYLFKNIVTAYIFYRRQRQALE